MADDAKGTLIEPPADFRRNGAPDVFSGSELSEKGLLILLERARRVRAELRRQYPQEIHACHVWAMFRAI
jgi:hypothetical protein